MRNYLLDSQHIFSLISWGSYSDDLAHPKWLLEDTFVMKRLIINRAFNMSRIINQICGLELFEHFWAGLTLDRWIITEPCWSRQKDASENPFRQQKYQQLQWNCDGFLQTKHFVKYLTWNCLNLICAQSLSLVTDTWQLVRTCSKVNVFHRLYEDVYWTFYYKGFARLAFNWEIWMWSLHHAPKLRYPISFFFFSKRLVFWDTF